MLIAPSPMALKRLIDVCEKYSIENDITYNATKTVCMYIRPKHMYHIGPVQQFLLQFYMEMNYVGLMSISI